VTKNHASQVVEPAATTKAEDRPRRAPCPARPGLLRSLIAFLAGSCGESGMSHDAIREAFSAAEDLIFGQQSFSDDVDDWCVGIEIWLDGFRDSHSPSLVWATVVAMIAQEFVRASTWPNDPDVYRGSVMAALEAALKKS
jgi:hypothetical protein